MQIKRTDANQKQIMDGLRKYPFISVNTTHTIGKGFPDIVVGYEGKNYLFEIKDGNKTPSQKKLTPDEIIFHRNWNGQVAVVESVESIIEIIQYNKFRI